VRIQGLRPDQLQERKRQIRDFHGEVPTQDFATASFRVPAGDTCRERVTVPNGKWSFARVILQHSDLGGGVPTAETKLMMEDQNTEVFGKVPFADEEIDLPLQRLRRRMRVEVDNSRGAAPINTDLLIPLYRSNKLLQLPENA